MTAIRHFQQTEPQQQEPRTAYEQCKHGPMRTRLQAVRLYGLEDQRKGGNRALLNKAQLQAVRHKLHQYRPVDVLGPAGVATASGQHWTVPDLKQALRQWQDFVYQSRHSYRELFQRCGFSYQRATKVFRSHSAEKVAEFSKQLEKN